MKNKEWLDSISLRDLIKWKLDTFSVFESAQNSKNAQIELGVDGYGDWYVRIDKDISSDHQSATDALREFKRLLTE